MEAGREAGPYVGMELASGDIFPVSGSYVCVRHVDESEACTESIGDSRSSTIICSDTIISSSWISSPMSDPLSLAVSSGSIL